MSASNEPLDYAARAARARRAAEAAGDAELASIYRRVADSYAELVELMPTMASPTRAQPPRS